MPLGSPIRTSDQPVHSVIIDPNVSKSSLMRKIREAYADDPMSLIQPNDQGLSPMSVAAIAGNLPAINVLLDIARPKMAEGEDVLGLQDVDDNQETPSSYNFRILRENPRFKIHDLLEASSKELKDAVVRNRLPACTCGKCTGKWLSPRMRFRLRETAKQIHTAMLAKSDVFVGQQPLDCTSAREDRTLSFLPSTILEQGICEQFYVGYRAAFKTIYTLLGEVESLPTVQNIRLQLARNCADNQQERRAVKVFAERGGCVVYALDHVVHQALWKSPTPLGDGSFDQEWDVSKPPLASTELPNELSPRIRRRSNSFKEALHQFGKKERRDWLLDIKEDSSIDVVNSQSFKLKEEWEASGAPGCALDTQFSAVRYLMGIHSEPRWEVDEVDIGSYERTSCRLRRM